MLLTTHYLEEAEKLCDRIGIISSGQIVAIDEKEKLLESLSKPKIRVYLKEGIGDKGLGNGLKYEASQNGNVIEIEFSDYEKDFGKIFSSLQRRKIAFTNVELVKDRLEDVYLKLTGNEDGGKANELDRF